MRRLLLAYLALFAALLASWGSFAQLTATGVGGGGFGAGGGGGGGSGVAPALDVLTDGSNFGPAASAASVHLNSLVTTSGTNRILVALVVSTNDATAGAAPTFTSVTGSTLGAFTKRSSFAFTGTAGRGNQRINMEIWWKLAAAQISTSEDVTAATTGGVSADFLLVQVFAVSGCNTAAPWDPNASLPKKANGPEPTPPAISGASITNSGTLGLSFGADATTAGGQNFGAATGWTINTLALSGEVVTNPFTQAFTTPQSTTFNMTTSATQPPFGDWGIILEALTSP